jgi:hypothetical protein
VWIKTSVVGICLNLGGFFALIKGLNVARQSAVDGAAAGCLCGVESPQYSASELIQLRAGGGGGGSDFYNSRRPLNCNDRGSDGSLDNDDEEGTAGLVYSCMQLSEFISSLSLALIPRETRAAGS